MTLFDLKLKLKDMFTVQLNVLFYRPPHQLMTFPWLNYFRPTPQSDLAIVTVIYIVQNRPSPIFFLLPKSFFYTNHSLTSSNLSQTIKPKFYCHQIFHTGRTTPVSPIHTVDFENLKSKCQVSFLIHNSPNMHQMSWY